MNWLDPEGENRPLPSKLTMTFRRGEVFREEVAGAGGWGDPLERDPTLVLKDVRNEFVSLAAARDGYGVVIDTQGWTVDAAATAALRARLRAARQWGEAPPFSREPALPAKAAAE
jgi:N-methylhydantoinase B